MVKGSYGAYSWLFLFFRLSSEKSAWSGSVACPWARRAPSCSEGPPNRSSMRRRGPSMTPFVCSHRLSRSLVLSSEEVRIFFEGLYFQENFIWKTSILKTETELRISWHYCNYWLQLEDLRNWMSPDKPESSICFWIYFLQWYDMKFRWPK